MRIIFLILVSFCSYGQMISNRAILDLPNPSNTPSVVQSKREGGTGNTPTVSYASTPTDGNLLIIIATAAQSRTITTPSGFTLLSSQNGALAISRTIYVFYKIASSETNSYGITYSAGGVTYGIHMFEIQDQADVNPLLVVGTNEQLSSTTLDASSTDAVVSKNNILIACVSTELSSVGGVSWDNSFTDKLPTGTTNTISSTARRTYSAAASGENSQYTLATTTNALSILLRVK